MGLKPGRVGWVGQVGLVGQAGRVRDAGFSLVELVVAMAVSAAVMAGVFTALQAAYGRFGAETDASDGQQRLRVAADALYQDLAMASVVLPFRPFPAGGDPPGTFRTDVITLVYLPDTAAQTTIAQALAARSGDVAVNADPGCPVGDAACGFEAGDTVIVYGPTWAFDPFEINGVNGATLSLSHLAPDGSSVYATGARIARAVVRTYFIEHDVSSGVDQLVRQDAGGRAVPIVDRVRNLAFEYFADGGAVPLAAAELTDGPWEPDASSPNRVDADLRRIRRIAATMAIHSGAGDRVVRLHIAPRNLAAAP